MFVAQPLPALAHGNLLGRTGREDRVERVLALRMGASRGFEALPGLGGADAVSRTGGPAQTRASAPRYLPKYSSFSVTGVWALILSTASLAIFGLSCFSISGLASSKVLAVRE